jgi:NAD(P)-dependent dehydrogenase (short-subunit alcohol dehydrogenase family)
VNDKHLLGRRNIGIKGSPAYTAAKRGVIGLTRAALDYAAQNIRINAVCPGYIDTPMMGRFTGGTPEGRARVIAEKPVGRMGNPEEIAAAVMAVLGRGRLHGRPRHGDGRGPNGAVMSGVFERRPR